MIRKATVTFLLLNLFLLSGSFGAEARANHRLSMSGAKFQVEGSTATVSFAELGYNDTDLISPYDSTSVFFTIPPNWRLVQGAEIKLDLDVYVSGANSLDPSLGSDDYSGTLSISLNNVLIASEPLIQTGRQSISFQIPPSALVSPRADGRFVLSILLTSQFSCTDSIRTLVSVKSTSTFVLPFEVSSPVLNLSDLPAPFYQRNSLLPDRTLLVVPDNPEAKELESAFNVMAGFGSLVGRDFDLHLVSSGQLTEADVAASNLIFVGTPDKFNLLPAIAFPYPVVDGKFSNLPDASAQDGVVQMAVSPWNANKVIMLVSGISGDAVAKAGQAVSSSPMLVYENPAVTFISDVKLYQEAAAVSEDFTLHDLGYVTQTLSGIGAKSTDYIFTISKKQVGTKDAYFDMVYYHSGAMDYNASSLAVYLNDQIISSIVFEKNSESVTTLNIKFPPGVLKFGENRLSIRSEMQPQLSCDTTGLSDPWVTIVDQSNIHVPISAETDAAAPLSMDLKFFPGLLLGYGDLGDVAMVLPKSDPLSWRIAGDLSYFLGRTANPLISNLKVAFADDVSDEVRANYSLIVIGKPSDIPLLLEINESLPAPFDFSNNTASEKQLQIVYRIPEGVSVGYLQLLSSPFNATKALLVITGNTDSGLPMAANALFGPEFAGQLAGVFAVTNGTQIATGRSSSIFSIVGTVVPGSEQIIATPLSNSSTTTTFEQPGWLIPILILSSVLLVIVIVFVATRSLSRNRSLRVKTTETDSGDPKEPDLEK